MEGPGPLILPHRGVVPTIGEGVFLAPGCSIVGDVVIGPRASVWFGSVVRGDIHRVRIGAETNIQDGCVLHVTGGSHPLDVAERVTVGHGVILHGCIVLAGAMIGMGALVMDGAVIGEGSLVGAGSLVPPGAKIQPGVLVLGSPAKMVRRLTEEERIGILESADRYVALAAAYREDLGGWADRSAGEPLSSI